MIALRFHGRGGQGVVTSAELLPVAAFLDGRHAQAFPFFGSERTGAPVASFCRVDDLPIKTHDPVSEPDIIVIQDPTLLHQVDVFAGLRDGGLALINSAHDPTSLGLEDLCGRARVLCVPATDLAREHLGRPMPGAPLLGALAALTGVVSIQSIAAAITERFGGRTSTGNVAAARAAFGAVDAGKAAACRSRSRGLAPWPRPSPAAARRSSPRIPSPRRRTSSKGSRRS